VGHAGHFLDIARTVQLFKPSIPIRVHPTLIIFEMFTGTYAFAVWRELIPCGCGSSSRTDEACDASVLKPRRMSVTPTASQTRVLLGTGIKPSILEPDREQRPRLLALQSKPADHQKG